MLRKGTKTMTEVTEFSVTRTVSVVIEYEEFVFEYDLAQALWSQLGEALGKTSTE